MSSFLREIDNSKEKHLLQDKKLIHDLKEIMNDLGINIIDKNKSIDNKKI